MAHICSAFPFFLLGWPCAGEASARVLNLIIAIFLVLSFASLGTRHEVRKFLVRAAMLANTAFVCVLSGTWCFGFASNAIMIALVAVNQYVGLAAVVQTYLKVHIGLTIASAIVAHCLYAPATSASISEVRRLDDSGYSDIQGFIITFVGTALLGTGGLFLFWYRQRSNRANNDVSMQTFSSGSADRETSDVGVRIVGASTTRHLPTNSVTAESIPVNAVGINNPEPCNPGVRGTTPQSTERETPTVAAAQQRAGASHAVDNIVRFAVVPGQPDVDSNPNADLVELEVCMPGLGESMDRSSSICRSSQRCRSVPCSKDVADEEYYNPNEAAASAARSTNDALLKSEEAGHEIQGHCQAFDAYTSECDVVSEVSMTRQDVVQNLVVGLTESAAVIQHVPSEEWVETHSSDTISLRSWDAFDGAWVLSEASDPKHPGLVLDDIADKFMRLEIRGNFVTLGDGIRTRLQVTEEGRILSGGLLTFEGEQLVRSSPNGSRLVWRKQN